MLQKQNFCEVIILRTANQSMTLLTSFLLLGGKFQILDQSFPHFSTSDLILYSWCVKSSLATWNHQSTCWRRCVYRPACIPAYECDAIRCHYGRKRTLGYTCCHSVHCLILSDNWLGGSFHSGSGLSLKMSLFWKFWTIYCTQMWTKFTRTIPLGFAKSEIFLTICHCKHI